MKNNITDYTLLLLLAVIWSASFLMIKVGVESIPPFTLTAARLVMAAAIFCIYLALRGEWIPMHPKALLLYLVSGLVGNSLPFVLISWGETSISSSLTSILMGIMPIATFVLAHIFVSEESMTRRKALGVAFGFSGLLVLVGLSALSSIGENLFGQLSVLGGATCYAIASVFVRTQPSFEGYKMAAGVNICAAIISTALAFAIEEPMTVTPTRESLIALVGLGLFPTAVASLIYFRVLKKLGATTFAQINYLIPILGGLWGILLLGEKLHWNVLVALVMVLCGIYLIQTRSKHRPQ